MDRVAAVRSAFAERFRRPAEHVARAPGRVNLIGEHTDYNEGFVLPMAIERDVLIACAARTDRDVVLHSLDFHETATFSLGKIERVTQHTWSNYVRGVARELQAAGVALRGIDAVLQGNVPIGAGLSSSAAFEVATALAFLATSQAEMDRVQVALLAQRAENRFVGMQCGIMDQFISALGQAGHALFIDTRDLSHRPVPLPAATRVVIGDTMTRRGLVSSAYNERRRQCEEAVRILQGVLPGVRALRDVTPEDLARYGDLLPPLVRKRAAHVVSEDARVLAAVRALEEGQAAEFGRLMDASHASLRDDYEVSSPQLDLMVELARQAPGCLGARMTGAGFGGATVSLVREGEVSAFVAQVAGAYEARTGLKPEITVTAAAAGAGIVA
ncbi:MAG TPA: galactokinase [Anaerolineae bacterium]|nr:galactokinase [Anaerolineae bacterium]HOG46755.1 galactokinase [Anaerolineae bacterium]HOQ98451.1 galactokinase [Anaerolineae bacterium]HPL26734.1 galactokinase [Anaerolineae bacterium]